MYKKQTQIIVRLLSYNFNSILNGFFLANGSVQFELISEIIKPLEIKFKHLLAAACTTFLLAYLMFQK